MLHFQSLDMEMAENDENLDYDSDFDDLEELLSELIKHKVSLKCTLCDVLLHISKTSHPGECGTVHACNL